MYIDKLYNNLSSDPDKLNILISEIKLFSDEGKDKKSFWERHKGKILGGAAIAAALAGAYGGYKYANNQNEESRDIANKVRNSIGNALSKLPKKEPTIGEKVGNVVDDVVNKVNEVTGGNDTNTDEVKPSDEKKSNDVEDKTSKLNDDEKEKMDELKEKLAEAKKLLLEKKSEIQAREAAELSPIISEYNQLNQELAEKRKIYWGYSSWGATPEQKAEHERLDVEIEDLKRRINEVLRQKSQVEQKYWKELNELFTEFIK